MNLKEELITAIYNKMNCDNIFDKGLIEKEVDKLEPEQYMNFYDELFGEGFDFAKGLDRLKIVSKRFKDKNELPLIEAVKSEAQAISDSLYAKSCALVKYADANRDKFPTDRDLFMNEDFGMMYKAGSFGEHFFNEIELKVIYDLAREWFLQISSLNNFGEVLKAVERSLAKEVKVDQGLIAANVRKLISK